jgi:hypothetical protein
VTPPTAHVSSIRVSGLELVEAFEGLPAELQGIPSDAHLTRALDVWNATVERVDELAEGQDEVGALDVRC